MHPIENRRSDAFTQRNSLFVTLRKASLPEICPLCQPCPRKTRSVSVRWVFVVKVTHALAWAVSQHTDTSKNTRAWAVSQDPDTSKNTRAWAVSQHTDTSKNTRAWAVSQDTDTSKNTRAWAVSQDTDTSKNTRAWAVSQHTDTSKNTRVWAVSQDTDTSKNTRARLKPYALHIMRGLTSVIRILRY